MPNNTWWIDSCATTHVSHILQGFLTIQPIKGTEQHLFMGNRMKAQIEGIRTYRLFLDTGRLVDLDQCLYVPECARNLVSLGKLDRLGLKFEFSCGRFMMFLNNALYGGGSIQDWLYSFNLDNKFSESLFYIGNNCGGET